MPPAEDVQRQMFGAWRMMTGHREGIRLLDLSADGFWNSFFAILVAGPALMVSWAPIAAMLAGPDANLAARLSFVVRLAIVDVGAWVIPLAILAAVAGAAGVRDRFVHYVVATNWGGALFGWFMLPASLLRLVAPGMQETAMLLSLAIFLTCLVLSWRLTNAAIDKGAPMATAVFGMMLVASIVTLLVLQQLLGVAPR